MNFINSNKRCILVIRQDVWSNWQVMHRLYWLCIFLHLFLKSFIHFLAGNGPGACRPFIIVLFPCPILLFSDSLQLPFGILHRNAIFLACEHALAHTYKTTTMRMLIRCILFVRVASLCVAATFLYYFEEKTLNSGHNFPVWKIPE